jgi:hypothetical protein
MPDQYLSPFALEAENCQRITTGGGLLLLAPLTCPNNEPDTVIWTNLTAAAVAANTLSLRHDQAGEVYISAGTILTFGANIAVVTATTLVPTGATGTNVPVEALTAAIAANATATLAKGVLRLLSPTNIPINLTSQKEDSTDLDDGIKSSEVVTSVATSIAVSAFDSVEDRALYSLVFPLADVGGQLFAMAVRSNGVVTAGRAIVSNYTNDQAVKTVSKVQFSLDFQGKYANISPYRYLTVAQKTALNNLRKFMGLSVLV